MTTATDHIFVDMTGETRLTLPTCRPEYGLTKRRLTTSQAMAERFYAEDDDSIPYVPFDTLCTRYGQTLF